jgi:type I restriction enzyme M protein
MTKQEILDLLQELLRDSAYSLTLFSESDIERLIARIIIKADKNGKKTLFVQCLVRKKEIKCTPEEVVRQLYLDRLTTDYGYSLARIAVEHPVQFGSDSSKRADIVIFDENRNDVVYIVIEIKKPKFKEGKEQLKSYCNATGAPMGVWTNGQVIEHYYRKEPNKFDGIPNIPNASQTLNNVLNARFTIWDLMTKNKLQTKSLKQIIEEFEDEVLANAGVDVFEEVFKLIFAKLHDEFLSGTDKDKIQHWLEFNLDKTVFQIPKDVRAKFRNLEFRNTGVDVETQHQIVTLFDKAKAKWSGIFSDSDQIKLSPSHLQTCVSYIEDAKLFNSNLEIIDEAFEYLVNKDSRGEKGQYFTPRYVIDMCVKMLNPSPNETMIDTAAGSCGFPVHTIFHVWQRLNPDKKNLFTTDTRTDAQIDYVRNKVFAIDFDEKTVRVGRTLNLIAGDGETNVLLLNSLDYERWEADSYDRKEWRSVYGKGFENLEKLKANKKGGWKEMKFDIVMANPPFAGDIKDSRIITKYDLGKKRQRQLAQQGGTTQKLSKNKGWHEKISRHILFIERNLDMLRPGGRMAIVLPQGVFNNSTDDIIREFIAERCRILAVVGLHGNTFKPHAGVKTSVLLVQKWTDPQGTCPHREDYPIFFATQRLEGKNNSGEKLYWLPNLEGTTTKYDTAALDVYGHPVVYHDLFQTLLVTGKSGTALHTPEGITEAFQEFARKERLPFF